MLCSKGTKAPAGEGTQAGCRSGGADMSKHSAALDTPHAAPARCLGLPTNVSFILLLPPSPLLLHPRPYPDRNPCVNTLRYACVCPPPLQTCWCTPPQLSNVHQLHLTLRSWHGIGFAAPRLLLHLSGGLPHVEQVVLLDQSAADEYEPLDTPSSMAAAAANFASSLWAGAGAGRCGHAYICSHSVGQQLHMQQQQNRRLAKTV